jgi:hypothetical protein
MIFLVGLGHGRHNVNPAKQCHLIASLHALLPVKVFRDALVALADSENDVLRLVSGLGEPRQDTLDLRPVEGALESASCFPRRWFEERRDAVETTALLLNAVDVRGGIELAALFRGRLQMVRVTAVADCAMAPCVTWDGFYAQTVEAFRRRWAAGSSSFARGICPKLEEPGAYRG